MQKPAPRAKVPPPQTSPVAEEEGQLSDELDFMRTLWALNHALEKTSRRMMDVVGITAPQRLVIKVVGQTPGISPGDVARMLHLHPSTLTGMLQRLEARRLLRRQVDRGDRRRSHLYLTPKGNELTPSLKGSVEECVLQILDAWPRPKVRSAREVLTDLARILDDRRPKIKKGALGQA